MSGRALYRVVALALTAAIWSGVAGGGETAVAAPARRTQVPGWQTWPVATNAQGGIAPKFAPNGDVIYLDKVPCCPMGQSKLIRRRADGSIVWSKTLAYDPSDLTIDRAGNVYVLTTINYSPKSTIVRIDPTGSKTTLESSSTLYFQSVQFGADGRLYYTTRATLNSGDVVLHNIDPATGAPGWTYYFSAGGYAQLWTRPSVIVLMDFLHGVGVTLSYSGQVIRQDDGIGTYPDYTFAYAVGATGARAWLTFPFPVESASCADTSEVIARLSDGSTWATSTSVLPKLIGASTCVPADIVVLPDDTVVVSVFTADGFAIVSFDHNGTPHRFANEVVPAVSLSMTSDGSGQIVAVANYNKRCALIYTCGHATVYAFDSFGVATTSEVPITTGSGNQRSISAMFGNSSDTDIGDSALSVLVTYPSIHNPYPYQQVDVLRGVAVTRRDFQDPPVAGAVSSDYVGLGDSYSSGEGLGHYELLPVDTNAANNRCHRSSEAYENLILPMVTSRTFRACSGAVTGFVDASNTEYSFEPAQKSWLGPSTKYVTMTIGGDDLQWSAALQSCAILDFSYLGVETTHELNSTNCASRLAGAAAQIAKLEPKLEKLYTELITSTSAATEIRVLTYPTIFPAIADGTECTAASATIAGATGAVVYDSDTVAAFRTAEATFNDAIRTAVSNVATAQNDPNLQPVNIDQALSGHEISCGQTGRPTPYVNGLVVSWGSLLSALVKDPAVRKWKSYVQASVSTASFHPRAQGQQAMAQTVDATW